MKIRSKLYKMYRYRIFPKVKDIRGAYRINRALLRFAGRGIERVSGEEESIFDKGDWDNLIILDACRHDLYEEVNGETESRVSVDTHTKDFLNMTFSDRSFDDIICVTGNPQYSDPVIKDLTGSSNPFHVKYDIYNTDWDEEKGTVMPEPLVEKAKSARKLFPEKKMIVHFMQPHYPFVKAEDLNFGGQADGKEIVDGKGTFSVWDAAEKGYIDQNKVWEAYKQNLEFVMPYVEELAEDLPGKTVITSDHGNLAGENGLYGHPGGLKYKPLRKVPWDEK